MGVSIGLLVNCVWNGESDLQAGVEIYYWEHTEFWLISSSAQAANPDALLPEGAPGRTGSGDCSPSRPRHGPDLPRRGPRHAAGAGSGLGAGPERLAGGRRSCGGGAGREQSTAPTPTPATATLASPGRTPQKADFPEERPRPVRPPAPVRTPPGVALPQLWRPQDAQRMIREGGEDAQAGQGAGHGSAERGMGC